MNLIDQKECHICNSSWHGGSIHAEFMRQRDEGYDWCKGKTDDELWEQVKEYYSPPYTWSRLIAIELDQDRVEYYICPDCFTVFAPDGTVTIEREKSSSFEEVQQNLIDHIKTNNNDNQSNQHPET